METNKKYYPIAFALYFTYLVHGIGVSILAQYKQNFAEKWGATTLTDGTFDVSMVLTVIAALGLGRLISLPIAGPLSDKFGRRVSGLIGITAYVTYFIGLVFSPSMYVAYAFALLGGVANSFIDTAVYPAIMEIFKKKGDVGNLFVKFSISIGQFLLPFMIGFVAANTMPFTSLFYLSAILLAVSGVLMAVLPFPPMLVKVEKTDSKKSEKLKLTGPSLAIVILGFTVTSTFILWLNANQELGKLYGLADPSKIQSYYALGTVIAILVTSYLINKKNSSISSSRCSLPSDCCRHVASDLLCESTFYFISRWFRTWVYCCRWSTSISHISSCRVITSKRWKNDIGRNDRFKSRKLHDSNSCRSHHESWRSKWPIVSTII